MNKKVWYAGAVSIAAFSAGCGSESDGGGTGSVRVLLTAEETITDGLDKGTDVENTQDYNVRYSKFLATVGNVKLGASNGQRAASIDEVYVVDMKQVGEAGIELGLVDELQAGEWDKFGFETPLAAAGAKAGKGVSSEDLAKMIDQGWTYWIEGVVEGDQGDVQFVIQTDTPTLFTDCEYEGEPGVTVVEDGTATATITLHGDHIFFNAFPTGTEGSIKRLSGWVIDADQDGDGLVVTDDLLAVDATEVFTTARGYSLDGAPIPIANALDYVRAQLATQGHYKGEGECIWEFEGVTGD